MSGSSMSSEVFPLGSPPMAIEVLRVWSADGSRLLLYPEGLLMPYMPGTPIASSLVLALLLVAGSFAAVGALYFLGTFFRRNAS